MVEVQITFLKHELFFPQFLAELHIIFLPDGQGHGAICDGTRCQVILLKYDVDRLRLLMRN